ncbi:hypothetical protein EYC80_007174 [Monilinia laxa]|uniref:Uncharacterized protein n=1 Tax=Monilinia laxa TaxID=61186 RepID=A0A5N6K0E6_MONLA|nr:hypothetical protein EYC80_007174 [Monilinia laxa]
MITDDKFCSLYSHLTDRSALRLWHSYRSIGAVSVAALANTASMIFRYDTGAAISVVARKITIAAAYLIVDRSFRITTQPYSFFMNHAGQAVSSFVAALVSNTVHVLAGTTPKELENQGSS